MNCISLCSLGNLNKFVKVSVYFIELHTTGYHKKLLYIFYKVTESKIFINSVMEKVTILYATNSGPTLILMQSSIPNFVCGGIA